MSIYKSKDLVLYVKLNGTDFVAIGQITNLKPPSPEQQFEDATVLESDHVVDGEPVGLATPGECSGELLYDPTNTAHLDFYAKCGAEDAVPVLCEIRKALTVRWRFNGTPSKFEPTAAVKSFMKASFAIKAYDIALANP
jgi:hypothetical protein